MGTIRTIANKTFLAGLLNSFLISSAFAQYQNAPTNYYQQQAYQQPTEHAPVRRLPRNDDRLQSVVQSYSQGPAPYAAGRHLTGSPTAVPREALQAQYMQQRRTEDESVTWQPRAGASSYSNQAPQRSAYQSQPQFQNRLPARYPEPQNAGYSRYRQDDDPFGENQSEAIPNQGKQGNSDDPFADENSLDPFADPPTNDLPGNEQPAQEPAKNLEMPAGQDPFGENQIEPREPKPREPKPRQPQTQRRDPKPRQPEATRPPEQRETQQRNLEYPPGSVVPEMVEPKLGQPQLGQPLLAPRQPEPRQPAVRQPQRDGSIIAPPRMQDPQINWDPDSPPAAYQPNAAPNYPSNSAPGYPPAMQPGGMAAPNFAPQYGAPVQPYGQTYQQPYAQNYQQPYGQSYQQPGAMYSPQGAENAYQGVADCEALGEPQGCQDCGFDCGLPMFYFSAFAGNNNLQDMVSSNNDTIFSDRGPGFGVAIGQRHGYNLRSELEFAYRSNNITGIETNTVFQNLTGDITSYAGMANAYWEFMNFPHTCFKPYVGAGIGFVSVNSDLFAANGQSIIPQTDNNDTSLAYQAIAGVNYKAYRNMDLFIEYRYFAAESLRLDTLTGFGSGKYEYQNDGLFAGLRWKF